MVYLVKYGDKVLAFYSEGNMKNAGHKKADKTVTEEIFNSNGCYARLINGEIIIGKTDEEKKQDKINELKAELDNIDRKTGIPRIVRDVCLAAPSKGLLPENHPGLSKLEDAEAEAAPLRQELAPLLA